VRELLLLRADWWQPRRNPAAYLQGVLTRAARQASEQP
jgi:hypothetical protein